MSKLYYPDQERNSFVSEANDMYLAVIDGKAISTLDEFYVSIAQALKFPDYFGENLDALDEMLFDLDWIEHQSVMLVVKNSEWLLRSEEKNKERIISLINQIDNPYFEVCFL